MTNLHGIKFYNTVILKFAVVRNYFPHNKLKLIIYIGAAIAQSV